MCYGVKRPIREDLSMIFKHKSQHIRGLSTKKNLGSTLVPVQHFRNLGSFLWTGREPTCVSTALNQSHCPPVQIHGSLEKPSILWFQFWTNFYGSEPTWFSVETRTSGSSHRQRGELEPVQHRWKAPYCVKNTCSFYVFSFIFLSWIVRSLINMSSNSRNLAKPS